MARAQKEREKQGSNTLLLLVLLMVLVGLTTWNYQRNVALQSNDPSPYAGVADADLDVLLAAYESELEALRAQGGVGRRVSARNTSGVARGVREFERVQRAGRSTREAGYAISEREAVVRALEAEKARRVQYAGGTLLVFLKRAFTLSL